MNGSYLLRLLCLCFASFFAVNATAGLLMAFASSTVLKMAESMGARSASRFLLAVRLLPAALGMAAVLALCVPSYLWLEPHASSERIGWICLALALLGTVTGFISIARATRALASSVLLNRSWRRMRCEIQPKGVAAKAVVVQRGVPLLALAGVFRPQLVVSQAVLSALSPEELELAVQHENAHRQSRDNLKRFFLVLVPPALPWMGRFSTIDRNWARYSEWAADDEAVRGDSGRALTLASALLRVARMGPSPRLTFLHTSLCADDHDLAVRVERLLQDQLFPAKAYVSAGSVAIGTSLGIALCTGTLLAWPTMLSAVHRLLELFLR